MPDGSRLNHNKFFKRRANEEYYPDQMSEQPHEKLTVRIRLNPNLALGAITTELRNLHNMELTRSRSTPDMVVISGIPSNNATREQQILQFVQGYDPNAELWHR